MFAKVFGQIFDSSIAEDYTVRHMFIDLLILADSDGAVDMTHEAISRRTNVPIETVKRCMDELSQPDPASRSPIHEGKRIVPLDSHRGWGWQIVNYRHYRQIRDEEVRRSYFRDQKRKQRKKERRTSSVQDKMVDNGGHCQTVPSASSSTSVSKGDSKGKPISQEQVTEFCRTIPLPDTDAEYFWNKWLGNGFLNGGKPMKDWKSVIRSWKAAGHLPSQNHKTNGATPWQSAAERKQAEIDAKNREYRERKRREGKL